MLCLNLTDGKASAELLKACLYHDLPETATGDIPAPVKWHSPVMRTELGRLEDIFINMHNLKCKLEPWEEHVLKFADGLELAYFCVDQRMLGNKYVAEMFKNIFNSLRTIENPVSSMLTADKLKKEMKSLQEAWNAAIC
jgi:5'-deoxynucleotidase YfbR-like HD superfamily hydrolase